MKRFLPYIFILLGCSISILKSNGQVQKVQIGSSSSESADVEKFEIGEQEQYKDAVTLESGSIIVGKIIELKEDRYLKIVTEDGEESKHYFSSIIKYTFHDKKPKTEADGDSDGEEDEEEKKEGNEEKTILYKDVVTLKDGTIIVGQIIDFREGEYIVLETKEGKELKFDADNVFSYSFYDDRNQMSDESSLISSYSNSYESIELDDSDELLSTGDAIFRNPNRFTRPKIFKEKGLYFQASFGVMVGANSDFSENPNDPWNQPPEGDFNSGLNFYFNAGYLLNPHFGVGIGLGMDLYDDPQDFDVNMIIPIYADVRYYLLKRSFSPFVRAGVGYGLPAFQPTFGWTEETKTGGLYTHPSAGFRFASRANLHFLAEFGIKFQKAKYTGLQWDGVTETEETEFVTYRKNSFTFSILF